MAKIPDPKIGVGAAETNQSLAKETTKSDVTTTRREIPGALPYLTAHGTLRNMLNKIIDLAKPDKFNYDFLENVVKMTGGGARACIPILKKLGFINSDNTTTEVYGKFRTDSGRGQAVYSALKNAFPEIFKRSDYAFSIDDAKLRDIITEITGLKANDPVAQAIKGTFNAVKSFLPAGFNITEPNTPATINPESGQKTIDVPPVKNDTQKPVGIVYNINIVLPETSDLNVLNAIFKSVRENLL